MAQKNIQDWWRGAALYQIYPRSFYDSNADGIGDLKGITKKISVIKDLCINGIWVSPFFTSPMNDFGYDVSDYKNVDPIFGTLDDFDALVAKCDEHAIKVIIDLVLSHTSDQHPWFKTSRASRENEKADWYVWADPKEDGTPPNNWLSVFGGSSWEWDTSRRQYYLHNFLTSQPDLNFHNGEVQNAVLDVARFWLDRGVHGFRLDTVNYYFHDLKLRSNPPAKVSGANTVPSVNPYGKQKHDFDKTRPENIAFLKKFRMLLNEYDAFAVGEVGDEERSLQTMADYTSGSDMLHMCYSFELLGPEFSPRHIRNTVEGFFNTAQDGWPCWAFSNHDVERHVSRWAGAGFEQDMARLCVTLLASLRGSLCFYQGEELGLSEAHLQFEDLQDPYGIRFWPEFKGRDGCRTPYPWDEKLPNAGFSKGKPWLPIPQQHAGLSFENQNKNPSSMLTFYQKILKARSCSPSLLTGELRFIESDDDLLVFERRDDNECRLCIFNFSNTPQNYTIPEQYQNIILSDAFTHGAVLSGGTILLSRFGMIQILASST
jgi:alpha-glucosidase